MDQGGEAVSLRGILPAAALALLAASSSPAGRAADLGTIRVGVLEFGTVNWELDVIKHHGLDAERGFTLEVQGFGSGQATNVALQGGAVDAVVDDYLWVSRQRAAGEMLSFVPFSSTVGALVVPPDSDIASLADLAGKKVGIAGGPIDKSWLLLQGLAAQRHGIDLAAVAEPVFAAPPLLNEAIQNGELDAVLNYWHFTARLEAKGYRQLVGVEEAIAELGVASVPPQLGYVFAESFGAQHPELIAAFVDASRAAKQLLSTDRGMAAHPAADQGRGRRHPRRAQAPLPRRHHRPLGQGRAGRCRQAVRDPGRARRREAGRRHDRARARHLLAGRHLLRPAGPMADARGAGARAGGRAAPPPRRGGAGGAAAAGAARRRSRSCCCWRSGRRSALYAGNPRRLPAPAAVLTLLAELTRSGELPYHLGITLLRVAASFVIAMVIGTAIGVVMGRSALVDRLAQPWLVFFLNVPALVTIVLAYIWIGLVEAAVIVAVAANKIPNVVVTLREGARALDRDLLEMAAVLSHRPPADPAGTSSCRSSTPISPRPPARAWR